MTDAVAEVRRVLADIVGEEVVRSVDDDDLIFQQRVVDSLHLVELVTRLESTAEIEIGPDDLSPDNFESIAAMARFVTAKAGR